MIFSVRFLFSQAHGRWRSRLGQPAQAARPNIRVYGACAVCRRVLVRIYGPEFEPSVEEIVDYPTISLWRFSQFAFSSELAFRAGGFPYSVEHMAGEGQPARAARPNSVCVYGACAVCQCVPVRIYGGVFVRDSGRSL